ncbi:MAG: hypothetical protein E5X34_29770 [Mesorhizobium sp.]|uniref:hypothetical protein n=1 Tax=Mesorhizobium sp. TaxID=1871066 RepID=UPI0012249EF3|nr:hypothetical protein [Mesorhizobium sp.]TIR15284.1 MAG: hypothetical protein E5X34_29770 [Mesorhizobium sp.]
MSVVPIPTTRRMRAWLDREALRIVAGVRAASVANVVDPTWRGHMLAGVDRDAAEADCAEVHSYLMARIAQIRELLSEPAIPVNNGPSNRQRA